MAERDDLFNALVCNGVVVGHCVMIEDSYIIYAGPLVGAPYSGGKLILLNEVDFDRLAIAVNRVRH